MKTSKSKTTKAKSCEASGEAGSAPETRTKAERKKERLDWAVWAAGVHSAENKRTIPAEKPAPETRTEKSVNWGKVFCPVCQPIVDGHFRKREAAFIASQEADDELIHRYKATNQALQAHADALAEAVKDMMHDLDIFYGKYRDKDNRYIANLKQALAAWEGAK